MSPIRFVEREIQLGEPPTLLGYGPALSAIRPARSSGFLFSAATEGIPARLRRVKLNDTSVSRGGTIRGALRDVWHDGNDLWVLATRALHRVSGTDLAVTKTIKVPAYLHRFVPLRSGQFLALSQPERRRTPVLSVGEGSLRGTITMPTPDLSIDLESGSLLLSFWSGAARAFDGELRPTRDRRELPLGLTPIRFGGHICFLEAEREVARDVFPPQAEVKWVYPTRHLATFEIDSWRVSRKAKVSSVDRLLGTDGDGRIVATDRASNTVSLLDAGTYTVHARRAFSHPVKAVDLVGEETVAYRSSEGRLFLVEWSTAV